MNFDTGASREPYQAEGIDIMSAQIERSMEAVEDYARTKPWSFAMWVFGAGFVLGWKLKPW
jgi:hypothetical protein